MAVTSIHQTLPTSLIPSGEVSYAILRPNHCKTTLLWLHGYRERSCNLLEHSLFQALAQQKETAILFPDVPDTYYLNQSWNHCATEEFLLTDFLPHVTKQYGLPSSPDATLLGGISMGGFGSLLLCAHHPERFRKVACLSSAFILDDLLMGNPEVVGGPSNVGHFQNLFGDLSTLADDGARNPWKAIASMPHPQTIPPIFLACGRNDLLYSRNQTMLRRLTSLGLDVSWREAPGGHHWDFFSWAVEEAFSWFDE